MSFFTPMLEIFCQINAWKLNRFFTCSKISSKHIVLENFGESTTEFRKKNYNGWKYVQVLDFAMKLWTSLENSWKWLRRLYTSLKLTSNVPYAWICFKGNLLWDIDNWSGLKILWTTSFGYKRFFQHEENWFLKIIWPII